MKCFVFVHSHLSSIQKGVQATHAVAQLMWQQGSATREWFLDHKTVVLLEGGDTESLADLVVSVGKTDFDYAIFSEDEKTLGGLTTALAIIIDVNEKRIHNFIERNLLVKIDEAHLAR